MITKPSRPHHSLRCTEAWADRLSREAAANNGLRRTLFGRARVRRTHEWSWQPGVLSRRTLGTRRAPTAQAVTVARGTRGGEPVDLATGIFVLEKTDLVLPGRLPVTVTRYYRSQGPAAGPFGPGTSHAYQVQLLIQRDFRTLLLPDGRRLPFPLQPDGTFRNLGDPAMRGAVLTATGGGHRLRFKDGTLWTFNAPVLGIALGFLVGVSDRNGNTISLTRDSFNQNLLAITDAAGRPLTFTYNGANQITQLTDLIGRAVRYDYDAAGRLALVHDPAEGVTRYTYDDRGQMLTVTDARGLPFLTNEYDEAGHVVAQTQADGGRWSFAYTTSSGVITQTVVTDPRGQTSTTRFTGRGYELAATDAQGQTVQSARDPATNLRLATTDALGRTTRFAYDAAGNVTSITDPAGQVTRFEYEPTFNRLTKLTDALGQVTTFTYDASGNLLTTTDSLNQTTTLAYNQFGQPTAVTDPLGQTTTFTYDDQGNLVTTTDPLGNRTQRTYDAVSRLIDLTDPKGRHTLFRYDDLNRVTEIADARQGLTRFSYDPNGNLLAVTDAKGQTTTYTYDQMDRLASRTDALGREETYQYDAAGNLSQFTDRKHQVSTFAYDPLNRRTGASYADGSTTGFVYDAVGRLAAAEDSVAGRIEFTYDALDRLIQEVTAQGSVAYQYDALGRRTRLTANGLPPVMYQYDAASRVTQVAQDSLTVGLAYDAAGRRTSLAYPNGTLTSYSYDDASRLTRLFHTGPAGLIEDLTYTYDDAGNRLSLTRATAQASLFPESIQAAYDAANEQIQFNSAAPNQTFDANGNLTSQTDATGTTTYTWDARNRLVAISGPGVTASFTYDALGRRVSKTINGVTTDFLYDGNDIVAEIQGGAVAATYLRSLSIDEPFVRQSAGGNEYYHTDALGSVLTLTNHAGAVTTSYSYEAFGKTTVAGTSSNAFQYTGRENDGTGLYYYRRRYYGSIIQRYLREDPLRLVGGSPNFYAYAENNPLKFVDPYGLYASPWHFILAFYAMISTGHDPIASTQTAIDSVVLDFVKGSQEPQSANWHSQRKPDQSIDDAIEGSRRFIQQQLDQCRLGFALHTVEDERIHKYEPYVEIGFHRQFLKHFIHDLFPSPSELSQSFQNDLEIINRYDKSRRKQQCP